MQRSFRNDLDDCAVWKRRSAEQMHSAIAHLSTQRAQRRASGFSIRAAIHRIVGEAIGVLVLVAKSVANLEALQLRDALTRLFPQWKQIGRFDFELALNLIDHEQRVGDDAQAGMMIFERPVQAGEQAGVLGDVVAAHAEELGELGEDVALLVVQDGAVAGGARVAARATVAVRCDPGFLATVVVVVAGKEVGGGGTRHQPPV